MNKKYVILITLLLTVVIGYSLESIDSAKIDITLIYREWLYDINTVELVSEKVQQEILETAKKKERKKERKKDV
jgi:hypothetical protein